MNKSITKAKAKKMYGDLDGWRGYGNRLTVLPKGFTTRCQVDDELMPDGLGSFDKMFADATFMGMETVEYSMGKTTQLKWSVKVMVDHTSFEIEVPYSMGSGHAYLMGNTAKYNKWAAGRQNNPLETLVKAYNNRVATGIDGKVYVVPKIPTTDAILWCLHMDASAYGACRDIDEFAQEYGYEDGKPSKTFEAWKACQKTFKDLHDLIDTCGGTLEELQDLFQDY